nr:aldolase/citrate lyase family protein [Neobacillus sp. Marseille-Q6967]
MKLNKVKQQLKNGERTLGIFLNFFSPPLVEMLGYSGFDFVVIDNEHGGFSDAEIEHLIRAAECADILPIVRISYDPSCIQKTLDRGARGIQIPMVKTKEQAEEIVRKAKYPPFGERGTTYSIRTADYGRLGGEDFLDHENENILIIVQIETPEAVENFEEIMSVPGIDVGFIGPLDLAVSSGYRKEGPKHPQVQKMIQNLHERAFNNNFVIGTIAPTNKDIDVVYSQGTQFVVAVLNSMLNQTFNEYVEVWDQYRMVKR